MKLRTPTEAARAVLLLKPLRRAQYENRKPTQEELNERWWLVRGKPAFADFAKIPISWATHPAKMSSYSELLSTTSQ